MFGTRGQSRSVTSPAYDKSKAKSPKVSSVKEKMTAESMTTEALYEILRNIQSSMENMNGSIETLNDKVTNIQGDMGKLGEFKTSLEFTQKILDDTKEDVAKLSSKIDQQEVKFNNVSRQLAESKRKNNFLNEKLLQMDSYLRRENLKFAGVKENKNESAADTIAKVQSLFVNNLKIPNGAELDYQRCHRIGSKVGNESRDIIIRFTRFQDRQLVWNNRKLFQGTNFYMKEDFPPEIDRRRAQLFPVLKAARNQNKKAMMIADKLIINGQKYTMDNIDNLPPELHPRQLAQRTTDGAVLFYGRDSIFSNFHDASFTVDGITYNCSEQYYQHKKAVYVGENEIAMKILNSNDATEQHKLGKKLATDDEQWKNVMAKQVMEAAVKAIFEQNPALKDILLSTGNKMLVECNQYDKVWGIGLKLNNDDALDRNKWQGENALGQILIQIREGLK